MRYTFIFPLFMLAFQQGNANQDSTVNNRRNEVGLMLNPIVEVLAGDGQASIFGFSYKRVKQNKAFRLGASYSNAPTTGKPIYQELASIVDSTFIRTHQNFSSRSVSAFVGIEKRKHFRSGVLLSGSVDVIYRNELQNHTIYNQTYTIDSVLFAETANPIYFNSIQQSQPLLIERSQIHQIGMGLGLGLLIPVKDRFWISTACHMEVFYVSRELNRKDYVAFVEGRNQSSNINFETRMPILELALHYRF